MALPALPYPALAAPLPTPEQECRTFHSLDSTNYEKRITWKPITVSIMLRHGSYYQYSSHNLPSVFQVEDLLVQLGLRTRDPDFFAACARKTVDKVISTLKHGAGDGALYEVKSESKVWTVGWRDGSQDFWENGVHGIANGEDHNIVLRADEGALAVGDEKPSTGKALIGALVARFEARLEAAEDEIDPGDETVRGASQPAAAPPPQPQHRPRPATRSQTGYAAASRVTGSQPQQAPPSITPAPFLPASTPSAGAQPQQAAINTIPAPTHAAATQASPSITHGPTGAAFNQASGSQSRPQQAALDSTPAPNTTPAPDQHPSNTVNNPFQQARVPIQLPREDLYQQMQVKLNTLQNDNSRLSAQIAKLRARRGEATPAQGNARQTTPATPARGGHYLSPSPTPAPEDEVVDISSNATGFLNRQKNNGGEYCDGYPFQPELQQPSRQPQYYSSQQPSRQPQHQQNTPTPFSVVRKVTIDPRPATCQDEDDLASVSSGPANPVYPQLQPRKDNVVYTNGLGASRGSTQSAQPAHANHFGASPPRTSAQPQPRKQHVVSFGANAPRTSAQPALRSNINGPASNTRSHFSGGGNAAHGTGPQRIIRPQQPQPQPQSNDQCPVGRPPKIVPNGTFSSYQALGPFTGS
ncbi:Hypothetical predicted protein [Lecanosticta acicola]|uniref:Uncharacterized protein n=1 Tax=Lecanosticta acicola TaxID=111012 RepID=A0AAI8Z6C2_9PEZI|nr:Hypothetical predicted protein [Lecanosticta acicola]